MKVSTLLSIFLVVCLAGNGCGKSAEENDGIMSALRHLKVAMKSALKEKFAKLVQLPTVRKTPDSPIRVLSGGACKLPVKKMPKYEPVLIVQNRLAVPAGNGHVDIGGKHDVIAACPGKNNSLHSFKGKDEVAGSCGGKEDIQIGGEGYAIEELGCVRSVSGELRVKGGKCGAKADGGQYMELGFKVQTSWFEMIQICHNPTLSHTLYAQHLLHGSALPSSEHQKNRPSFQEGGLYPTFNPDWAYKQANQLKTFTSILGSRTLAEQYLTNTSFLSRGHLSPNADFILDAYQDLSFFYVNTAPQWQRANAGNWGSVEKAVRKHALKQGQELRVVTGTHGTLKLRDVKGVLKEIYLQQNRTESRLPVPESFWKIVYEPKTMAGIAFVTLNDVFRDRFTASDLLCPDVCSRYGWRPSGGGSWHQPEGGYTYCCEIIAFKQAVTYLPRLVVKKTLEYQG